MTYGTIKVDTITFTSDGVDKSVAISGLVQNPTFTGNVTVTGTISGNTVRGQTISGVTITGTTAQFTSGTFISLTGTTTSGTTANFVSGVFSTELSGVTVTGTTANFTSGNFTNISGGTHTITSGVFASGTAANPSISFVSDPNSGLYSPGADQVAISTNGTGRLFVDSSGRLLVGTSSTPPAVETIVPQFVSSSASAVTGAQDIAIYNYQNAGGSGRTKVGPKLLLGNSRSGTNGSLGGIVTSGEQVGNIRFAGDDGSAFITAAEITAEVDGTPGTNDMPGRLVFSVTADGAASPTERMRISSSGNVGIGTTPVVDLDVAPAASTATFRIHARSNTTPVASIELVRGTNTTFGADGSGDYRIKNDTGNLSFEYGDTGLTTERLRIDGSGRLLVGTSTARANFFNTTLTAGIQVEGTGGTTARGALSVVNNDSSNSPALLILGRSGTASLSSNTVVANDDLIGTLSFQGADGTEFVEAARIRAEVDGTPGANDMPGRIVFSTTADSASSATERFRITNDGVLAHDQPAPAAVNATATLTVANLKTGIITSTSAAATDMTLPTGTDTEAGFSGVYTNMTFEWSVINTGPSLVRVLAGTAHTIVGSGSVATGTSGRFASRRTAANTFVTYRLS